MHFYFSSITSSLWIKRGWNRSTQLTSFLHQCMSSFFISEAIYSFLFVYIPFFKNDVYIWRRDSFISRMIFNGISRNIITLNIQSSPTFHTSVSPDDDTRKFGRFLNAKKLFSSSQLIIRSSMGFVYPISN